MSLKTIAVIPVRDRLPLLKVTLTRLYEKNGVNHIICIGETESERKVCASCGAEFIVHRNHPLGRKWNAGFSRAREYNPDAIVYVGSSDWLSDNWIPVLTPFIERGLPMTGKMDYNLLHYSKSGLKMGWWAGYNSKSGRKNELIGIGRLLSREFLDAVDWQPFYDESSDGMDGAMYNKLGELQRDKEFKPVIAYNLHEIQSVAVSCDKWSNMHSSDMNNPEVVKLQQPELWLKMYFPEALTLEL